MKFGTDGFRGPTDKKITLSFVLILDFIQGELLHPKGMIL